MSRVLVTGATGFVGTRLIEALLSEGHEPIVLSRSERSARARLPRVARVYAWQPEIQLPPSAAFEGADIVIHLAGEPIAARRWTAIQRQRIYDSRVLGTRHLVRTIVQRPEDQRPRLLISASAIGYYGDRGEEELNESSLRGDGFLARVCADWEAEAQSANRIGMRVLLPRFGLVLGESGGALEKMMLPFKMGLGGPLGSGSQWMSWIHIDDLIGLMLAALANSDMNGPMNAVSPHPVLNSEFSRCLAAGLGRPAFLRVPGRALKLALGELSQLVLASQKVMPDAAMGWGYQFRYPRLEPALEQILAGRE